MALPRRPVAGGTNGGRSIFLLCLVPLCLLGILLFHSLIGLSPHFFEVIGFCIARFPSQPLRGCRVFAFHNHHGCIVALVRQSARSRWRSGAPYSRPTYGGRR